MRLEVLVLQNPDHKTLRRLLRRHNGRILAVALVVEVESKKQVSALARHYRLRPLPVPATLFIEH
ncbi:hypothetical protein [Aeropyrum globular virus 1]|uniref:hypothetical protein n=1 Tax=Aeropyrum globular virus 1 TaxID=1932713 RepID=UPI000C7EF0BF|nr:hypothetical protein C1186_gp33 [Aeropyrum globular virus 1]BBC20952.1 hypothetical protein [Aeropyrum globular virus 1]